MIENSILAVIPSLETLLDIVFSGSGLQAHESVRKIVFHLIVLRRKVVRFGLPLLTDLLGELVILMHVMRDRPHVVKELTQEVPAAFAIHNVAAEQQIAG